MEAPGVLAARELSLFDSRLPQVERISTAKSASGPAISRSSRAGKRGTLRRLSEV